MPTGTVITGQQCFPAFAAKGKIGAPLRAGLIDRIPPQHININKPAGSSPNPLIKPSQAMSTKDQAAPKHRRLDGQPRLVVLNEILKLESKKNIH